jgi:hypothetical protein
MGTDGEFEWDIGAQGLRGRRMQVARVMLLMGCQVDGAVRRGSACQADLMEWMVPLDTSAPDRWSRPLSTELDVTATCPTG